MTPVTFVKWSVLLSFIQVYEYEKTGGIMKYTVFPAPKLTDFNQTITHEFAGLQYNPVKVTGDWDEKNSISLHR